MADNSVLHINCKPEDKAAWMRTARVRGQPLAEWVQSTLNAATVDTAPPWATGLSERAIICLLGAGIDSREALEEAIVDGFDIAALPNVGRRIEQEVMTWLQ